MIVEKNILILLFIFQCYLNADAQSPNIGIGTNTPQAKLDVVRSIRIGGVNPNSSYLLYDSVSGDFTWKNSSLFVPANQALIRHSAATLQGLYYNSGQLEYRNDLGIKQFSTNWNTGDGYVATNLGIGRINPQAPLHFASELGEKIIFYGGPLANYGIGILPSELQIHTDLPESSITFGYGSSTNFTELVRIVGDGRMGIGTNNPQSRLEVRRGSMFSTAVFYTAEINEPATGTYINAGPNESTYIRGNKIILNDIPGGKVGIGVEPFISDGILEIGGRVRISGAGPLTTAVYFNRSDNSFGGYVGTDSDNPYELVMHNGNNGHKLGMAYYSGALNIGPTHFGLPGHILVSRGPGSPPEWRNPTNLLFNNTSAVRITGDQFLNSSTPVDLTGMSRVVSVNSPTANILFSYNIGADGEGPNTPVIMDVVFDGVIVSRSIHRVGDATLTVTGTVVIPTVSGNHTIKMMGSTSNGWVIINPLGAFSTTFTIDCMFVQVLNK